MRLKWNQGALERLTERAAKEVLSEGADIVMEQAIRHIDRYDMPYETGDLRSKFKKRDISEPDVPGFEIVNESDHALYVEVGTVDQSPQPFFRKGLEKGSRYVNKNLRDKVK